MRKRSDRNIKKIVILIDTVIIISMAVYALLYFNKDKALATGSFPGNVESAQTKPLTGLANMEINVPAPIEPASEPTSKPKLSTIVFCGDILLDGSVRNKISGDGLSAVFPPEYHSLFKDADLAMANLEMSVSERGEPMADKQYTYRADPNSLSLIKDMGVDIVSVANNHSLDFGRDAFADTLSYLNQYDIKYVGGGKDKNEAMDWQILESGGNTVAFLAASRVLPVVDWYAGPDRSGLFGTYDPEDLYRQIELADKEADIVAVYVHWGVERSEIPEDYQTTMARGYIDAGADIVIGSHPHILQGFEYYKGKLIAYSLGNFIFSDSKKDTAALEITVDESGVMAAKLHPFEIVSKSTMPLNDPARLEELRLHLNSISVNAWLNEEFMIIG